MKLSAHYTKASILTSLGVLFAGAVVYFFSINYTANLQLDKNLSQLLYEAEEYAKNTRQPLQQYDADKDHAIFKITNANVLPRRYYDTVYHNPREGNLEAGRAVEDLITVNNNHYVVTITISRESTTDLIEVISMITLALIFCLIVILFIINTYVLNGLWKPFYGTLHQIKAFNVADVSRFKVSQNKVDEFAELNDAIFEMSTRVKDDYQNLKQFTENASHEMMTPLAVVTTKLDTLIQDETLSSGQLDQINDIYASINRSTRLNQSLMLLVKLDNHLITNHDQINLRTAVIAKINQFQELLLSRSISVEDDLQQQDITGSTYLVDILLNNLFSNAIRHNYQGGKIVIQLQNGQLLFKNTGVDAALDGERLFERFHKSNESQGTGLGLTLVRNICSYFGFQVCYRYECGLHQFIIDLHPLQS